MSPIRVVLEDGSTLGVIETHEALKKAEEMGLDLVEISPTARPPVCKITDYGKWKYDQAKKASEAKRNSFQSEVKQIRFRPKTDEHDLAFKIKNSREFIEEGHKVQFEVRFRGRENAHPDVGKIVLDRVAKELMDIAKLERMPKYENKSMTMLMAPK
jgi:translation initiation factor IF-3